MRNKVYYGEYSLKHWIDLILSGNIVLPDYQRFFEWEKEDAQHLIQAFKDELFVPPLTIGAYAKGNAKTNQILDGQQRLSSIFLAYLGFFPNKEYLAKMSDSNNIDDNSENNENQDNNTSIKWKFSQLLDFGKTKDEIVIEILKNNRDKYIEIDFNLDDKFFEDHYLGFSFLIPNESEQKNYFASTFIDINSKGKELKNSEIREALYYLDENLKDFLKPEYTSSYIITPKGESYRLDFVKYLSMISQYINDKDSTKNIAKGTVTKTKTLEKDYYLFYIQNVIKDTKSEFWGDYSKISELFPNDSWKERINNLGNYLDKMLGKTYKFNSIIYADMYLFGLVYYIIFNNKKIMENKIPELTDRIMQESNKFQNDKKGHAKSPSQLQYLKIRIQKSIEIYKGFIDESA